MTLSVDEFLRRFLLHLLPKRFMRIRNFGYLANRRRKSLLPLCFQLLGSTPQSSSAEETSSTEAAAALWICPKCGGPMIIIGPIMPATVLSRSPPVPLPTAYPANIQA